MDRPTPITPLPDVLRFTQSVPDEAPFLYLVYRNALVAVSPSLRNVEPSTLRPQAI